MIYVVTCSDMYYPEWGAGDWELVTRDLESAKARARGLLEGDDPRYVSAFVLAINEDNLHVSEAAVFGAKA